MRTIKLTVFFFCLSSVPETVHKSNEEHSEELQKVSLNILLSSKSSVSHACQLNILTSTCVKTLWQYGWVGGGGYTP